MDWKDQLDHILNSHGIISEEIVPIGDMMGNLLEIRDAYIDRDDVINFICQAVAAEISRGKKEFMFALGENLAERYCNDPDIQPHLCIRTGLVILFNMDKRTIWFSSGLLGAM
jgi:hypothetical protein